MQIVKPKGIVVENSGLTHCSCWCGGPGSTPINETAFDTGYCGCGCEGVPAYNTNTQGAHASMY